MTLSLTSATSNFNRKGWLLKIDMFVMLMCLLPGMTVWAAQIAGIKGPPNLFQVKRADSSPQEEAKIYSDLKKGDKICLLPPGELGKEFIRRDYNDEFYLRLSLGDGTEIILSENKEYKDTKCLTDSEQAGPCYCYTVKQPSLPPPPDLVDNLQKVTGRFLDSLLRVYYAVKSAATSGGEPEKNGILKVEIPMLGTDSAPAKLVAVVGRDTALHLVWEGGQPPYWVHVYRDGNPVREEGFVVDKPEIVFPNPDKGFPFLSVSAGQKYKVEVRGKENISTPVEGVFTVVADLAAVLPRVEMSKVKAIETENSFSLKDKDILITTLLVKNQAWLAAYQRVIAVQQDEFTSPFTLFLTEKKVREQTEE